MRIKTFACIILVLVMTSVIHSQQQKYYQYSHPINDTSSGATVDTTQEIDRVTGATPVEDYNLLYRAGPGYSKGYVAPDGTLQGNPVPPQVTAVMDADLYDYVFTILKDNMWFVVIVVILVILVLYTLIGIMFALVRGLGKRFDNSEYIEFGKLKIKNRRYKPPKQQSGNTEVDVEKFTSVIELVVATEMHNAITKTIEITNSIHNMEDSYNQQCNAIFNSTFSSVKNVFNDRLMSYVGTILKETSVNIYNSREYFFVTDFLKAAELNWADQSKDIITRNGFVEILEDKKRIKAYVEELDISIYQAMDVRKLESTNIKRSELDALIKEIFDDCYEKLETMFIRLGKLKQNLIANRNEKLDIIDNKLKESVTNTLSDIVDRFLIPKSNQETTDSKESTEQDK